MSRSAYGCQDAESISESTSQTARGGNIVVKKAYCDVIGYRDFKKDMHEAAFELIEFRLACLR